MSQFQVIFCALILVAAALQWRTVDSQSYVARCQEVTIPMCKNLGYNQTLFPNSLGHKTQREAGLIVHQFVPLVKVNCSEMLSRFLCFTYAPFCTVLMKPVLPCRSMCRAVRRGCETLMKRFGFDWPETLNCKKFPRKSRSICVGGRYTDKLFANQPSSVPTSLSTMPPATTLAPGPSCGALMSSHTGTIMSPNYPQRYPSGCRCVWRIRLPAKYHVIKFEVKSLFLEEDSKCYYDYLIFEDKLHNQVGPRYCGAHPQSFNIYVKGHMALVVFSSDVGSNKKGFHITYTAQKS
ncbi:protein mom-5 isoform X2 [Nematostella vectensis]|nr:protein mom-5 isoform X2 [Nematostella vectensis]